VSLAGSPIMSCQVPPTAAAWHDMRRTSARGYATSSCAAAHVVPPGTTCAGNLARHAQGPRAAACQNGRPGPEKRTSEVMFCAEHGNGCQAAAKSFMSPRPVHDE
jgi:hypothetical protein